MGKQRQSREPRPLKGPLSPAPPGPGYDTKHDAKSPHQSSTNSLSSAAPRTRQCPRCSARYPADFRVCPLDATELFDVHDEHGDPLIGTVLAETYDVLRAIGEGAMGRVYEARHRRLPGKRFAIKMLHADLARQTDVVSRFLREAEATSVLSHTNIVSILDVNRTPDGRPYIVAELLEGDQLGDYLERSGKLPVPEAVRICRQICQALRAAHLKDIVHRDIKPENVFLMGRDPERVVKVLDFGISRVGESAAPLTKTGMVMGTPAYMPPEQARGQRVDHRADIYSVGALLYEAVTGKRPFDGLDPISTLASVLSDEPARPCTLEASLPPGLELVIQKAMAKNPWERYRSMAELDKALAPFDTLLRAHPAHDEVTQPPPDEQRPSQTLVAQLRALATGRADHSERARVQLLALSVAAAFAAFAGMLDAIVSGMRWSRADGVVSSSEIALSALGAAALLIAPGIAWVRFVKERVWPSTPRAVSVCQRVQRVVVASLAAYGGVLLAVSFFGGALAAAPSPTLGPSWQVISFAAALLAGGATWFLDRLRARRS